MLFDDPDQHGRFVETFLVESWAKHLRQHIASRGFRRNILDSVLYAFKWDVMPLKSII